MDLCMSVMLFLKAGYSIAGIQMMYFIAMGCFFQKQIKHAYKNNLSSQYYWFMLDSSSIFCRHSAQRHLSILHDIKSYLNDTL